MKKQLFDYAAADHSRPDSAVLQVPQHLPTVLQPELGESRNLARRCPPGGRPFRLPLAPLNSNMEINPKIKVSVITMTFNREETLRRCLESLARQNVGRDCFELILVDVSDAPVIRVVQDFEDKLNISHLHTCNRGVAGNRNYGAYHARAGLLAYIDDDCIADPGWLDQLLASAEANPACLIGGSVRNLRPDNAISCAGQVITVAVDSCFNPDASEPTFFPGLNFAVSRGQYLAIGGCDEGFGRLAAEDRDFVDRWRSAGGCLVKSTNAIVTHSHRSDLMGFIRQYFNYGRGSWRYHALRRTHRNGGFFDSVRLHTGLLRYVQPSMLDLPAGMRLKVSFLLIVWELCNATGFVWQACIESPSLMLKLTRS